MACAQSVLEGLDEAGISTALAPLLSTLSRPEYVQGLLPHIGEVVDVLLGWALEPASPPTVASKAHRVSPPPPRSKPPSPSLLPHAAAADAPPRPAPRAPRPAHRRPRSRDRACITIGLLLRGRRDAASQVGVLLASLDAVWRLCPDFTLTVCRQLVADMEAVVPEAQGSWQARLRPPPHASAPDLPRRPARATLRMPRAPGLGRHCRRSGACARTPPHAPPHAPRPRPGSRRAKPRLPEPVRISRPRPRGSRRACSRPARRPSRCSASAASCRAGSASRTARSSETPPLSTAPRLPPGTLGELGPPQS